MSRRQAGREVREGFEKIVRLLLSPQLVGLDELQSTELDGELSEAEERVIRQRKMALYEGKTTRTLNIPRASLREVSHPEILERISSRLR